MAKKIKCKLPGIVCKGLHVPALAECTISLEKEAEKTFLRIRISKLLEKRRKRELGQKEHTTEESPHDRNFMKYAHKHKQLDIAEILNVREEIVSY